MTVGDVIYLVSNLLKISPLEACKYLNNIFSLGISFKSSLPKTETNRYKQKTMSIEDYYKWENETFQLLCDYLHNLKGIKRYQEQDKIEYYIDLFIFGTDEDKLWFKKVNQRKVQEIERELRK